MAGDAGRVPTDPRISRRRRTVARSRRRRVLLRACVAVALGVCAWAAFFSPLLEVRSIKVAGGKHVTARAVAGVAALEGDNLLLLSTAEIAEQVKTLPWVRTARVTRKLPGTVSVRVVERKASVALSLGAARWTIDSRGIVLAPGTSRKGLPLLAGAEVEGVRPGARVRSPEVQSALAAYRSMPPALRRRVVAAFAPTIERISFSLTGDVLVRFGAAERLRAKNNVLASILRRLRSENTTAAYVDVRVPSNPAVGAPRPR